METEVDNNLFNTKQNEINDWVSCLSQTLSIYPCMFKWGGGLH